MTPFFADDRVTIWAGDCLDILPTLPDNSVDAVVTDPPYGLEFMGKDWDSFKTDLRGVSRITGIPAVPGVRGEWKSGRPQSYDAGKPFQAWCEQWATECLRILKPGGHLLAFGGTRTWHRLTCAVEDAGFEIRDSIAWLYGSGFPKSLDVSKAIDRANGRQFEDRYALGRHIRERREAAGLTRDDVNAEFGYRAGCHHWETQNPNNARVPTLADWYRLQPMLGLSVEFLPLVERAEAERAIIGTRPAVPGVAFTTTGPSELDITAPATSEAAQWQGWGTALKPAFEPVVVARKPLAGTVAANVLRYGTGALNIDATRIGTTDDLNGGAYAEQGARSVSGSLSPTGMNVPGKTAGRDYVQPSGRWPANVALDHESAAALDQISGELSGRTGMTQHGSGTNSVYGTFERSEQSFAKDGVADSGGASRFFLTVDPDPLPIDTLTERFTYTAKAGSEERAFYWKLSCNCETVKPWSDTSPSTDTDGSSSDDGKSWSTFTSGSRPTDPYHLDTTSTTATSTSSTTTSRTSSSSPSSSTNGSTQAANSATANGGSPAASVASSSPSPLSTGTSAQKGGPSTDDAAPAMSRGLSAISVCGNCGAPAKRESHSTVKPLALMRWLVRLVTPPGGTILEPFAGSGATVEAALLEGFQCIAIEREPDYLPLITQRINRRRDPVAYLAAAGEDMGLFELPA